MNLHVTDVYVSAMDSLHACFFIVVCLPLALSPMFVILVLYILCSKSQAIKAQFVTAIAAVLGVSVGLLARRSEVAEELLLSFTAGGFVYLAGVNMLPGIVRTKSSTLQTVLEMGCFVLGVWMMVMVTFLE